MHRSPLVVAVGAVFAGLTALLVLAGIVGRAPVAFFVAIPLGVTAALLWYHGTGRLAATLLAGGRRRARSRQERRAREAWRRARAEAAQQGREDAWRKARRRVGPDGARDWEGDRTRAREGGQARARGRGDEGRDGGRGWDGAGRDGGRRWDGVGQDGGRGRGGAGRRSAHRGRRGPDGLTPGEAYRTLGLEPGADEAAIREAYRRKVKEAHPDADGGDEETFKRITRAYERLTE